MLNLRLPPSIEYPATRYSIAKLLQGPRSVPSLRGMTPLAAPWRSGPKANLTRVSACRPESVSCSRARVAMGRAAKPPTHIVPVGFGTGPRSACLHAQHITP
jgi:hypothetical protein